MGGRVGYPAPILFFLAILVVAGGVSLPVPVAAYQAAPNSAGRAANKGAFAPANHGPGHRPGAGTNRGALGFIAPPLLGSLGLRSRTDQQKKRKHKQEKYLE